MKVKFSKPFEKAVKKLSGNDLVAVRDMIKDVLDSDSIDQLTNCKKLVGYKNIYRLKVKDYRAFFYLMTIEDTVYFKHFAPRGAAYKKEMNEKLREADKEADTETENLGE